MSAGEFPPAVVRRAFFDRDGERCFVCRKTLRWEERGIGWSMHHRKPRGMGGTSDPRVASIANALTVCGSGTTGCHGLIERDREEALRLGLLIPTNATTETFAPAAVWVRRQDKTWWLLTESGRAVEVEKGMPS